MDIDALTGLYNSFKTRTPIDIEKPVAPSDLRTKSNVIKVPTCIIIGDWASGFMEDAMELNSLIDPKISNFCKLADSGAIFGGWYKCVIFLEIRFVPFPG